MGELAAVVCESWISPHGTAGLGGCEGSFTARKSCRMRRALREKSLWRVAAGTEGAGAGFDSCFLCFGHQQHAEEPELGLYSKALQSFRISGCGGESLF